MTAQTDKNKITALEFYDLMFNQCNPEEAIEKYAGDIYIYNTIPMYLTEKMHS